MELPKFSLFMYDGHDIVSDHMKGGGWEKEVCGRGRRRRRLGSPTAMPPPPVVQNLQRTLLAPLRACCMMRGTGAAVHMPKQGGRAVRL
jgi:hypothetical protein